MSCLLNWPCSSKYLLNTNFDRCKMRTIKPRQCSHQRHLVQHTPHNKHKIERATYKVGQEGEFTSSEYSRKTVLSSWSTYGSSPESGRVDLRFNYYAIFRESSEVNICVRERQPAFGLFDNHGVNIAENQ